MPQGRRGGRVQVNMMQYMELVERVDKLEALIKPKEVEQNSDEEIVLTKNELMISLDKKGIKYNPRDKKEYPIPERQVLTFRVGKEMKKALEKLAEAAPETS